MSTPINRPGTYRGYASECAVNTTKNGFPQLVLRFVAKEFYDVDAEFGEEPSWVDWSEYEADLVVYFVLFGAKGKCLNFEQVQKALDWDGVSFSDLDQSDWSSTEFQVNIEEEEFEGTRRLKGKWIDAHDASPGGMGLRKLEAPALAALDAQFAGQLTGKKITPKKAPKGKPIVPPKEKSKPKAKAPEPESESGPESELESESTVIPEPALPKAEVPHRATRSKSKNKPEDWPESCSRDAAWQKVCELKMASVTDDALSAAWLESVDAIAGPDADVSDVTEEQWGKIRNKVLEVIPSIPF